MNKNFWCILGLLSCLVGLLALYATVVVYSHDLENQRKQPKVITIHVRHNPDLDAHYQSWGTENEYFRSYKSKEDALEFKDKLKKFVAEN